MQHVTPEYCGDRLKISMEKEWISDISFFREVSSLRSRHLVLWSLETLTSQQRFYGT
jgi:hypothetical protein